MVITVWRTNKSNDSVFGNLAIDTGPFKCVTLENGDTLIPSGVVYDVLFMWSETFQQIMPHIIVPDRTSVEIHWANWVRDPKNPNHYLLDGCLSLGKTADFKANAVWNSKPAWIDFCKAITDQPSIKIRYVDDYGH